MATTVEYILNLTGNAAEKLEETGDAAEEAGEQTSGLSKATHMASAGLKVMAAAVIAAVPALYDMAQGAADAVNDLVDLSTRSAVAVDTIQGLILAFKGSGQSAGDAHRVLTRWPAVLAAATTGTGKQADALDRLGVSLEDANGNLRSGDEILRDTLVRFSELEGQTERNIAAADLFGAAGTKLFQALGDPKALEDFVTLAGRFGTDAGPQAAEAAAKWQRGVANLELAMENVRGLFYTLGGGALSDFVNDVAVGLQAVTIVLETSIENWGAMLRTFARQWRLLWKGEFTFDGFKENLQDAIEYAAQNTEDMVEDIRVMVESSRKVFTGQGSGSAPVLPSAPERPDEAEGGGGSTRSRAELAAMAAAAVAPIRDGLEEAWRASEGFAQAMRDGSDEIEAAARATLQARLEGVRDIGGKLSSGAGLAELAGGAGPVGEVLGTVIQVVSDLQGTVDSVTGFLRGLTDSIANADEIVLGFVEAVATEIVPGLLEAVPALIEGLVTEAIPALVIMLLDPNTWIAIIGAAFRAVFSILRTVLFELPMMILVELPQAIAAWWREIGGFGGITRAIWDWFNGAWQDIKAWFKDLFTVGTRNGERTLGGKVVDTAAEIFTLGFADTDTYNRNARHSGGRLGGGARLVGRTESALLERGEIVSPATGSMTQGARKGLAVAAGGESPTVVHIHAAVVDPNTVPAIVRAIERYTGPFGIAPPLAT